MRPILLTGGAPRLPVDAVRNLVAGATGDTAIALESALATKKIPVDLLLGPYAAPSAKAIRFDTRETFEAALKEWIRKNPTGVVVMAAAVNDYTPYQVDVMVGGTLETVPWGEKVPSKADEFIIRCKPAPKIVDQLRAWGLSGPLVAFKHEAADTVIAAAQSLRLRIAASLVVANSLDGKVQTLVDAVRIQPFPDRASMLAALTERLVQLARL